MDRLTALSTAGTIIQFVDFGFKILSTSHEIFHSQGGTLAKHEELQAIIIDAIRKTLDPVIIEGIQHEAPSVKDRLTLMRADEMELKLRVENVVLECLQFSTMSDRFGEVTEAHKDTFKWVFDSKNNENKEVPWSSFIEWLIKDDGIYWINGKAGSGKSTLMRYIYDHPMT